MALSSIGGGPVNAFVAPGGGLIGTAVSAAAASPARPPSEPDPFEACAVQIFAAHDHPMSVASLRAQVRRLDRDWDLEDFTEALASKGFTALARKGRKLIEIGFEPDCPENRLEPMRDTV